MTASRLAALSALTEAVGEAVRRGDWPRALGLLEQRRLAFHRIAWSPEAVRKFSKEMGSLQKADLELRSFCQRWREALKTRLEALNAGHLLRQGYRRPASEAKFVDVRK